MIAADARYLPYATTASGAGIPTGSASGSLRRAPPGHRAVPPDVTVSHNPPPSSAAVANGPPQVPPAPMLSTFSPAYPPPGLEAEGHLV